MANGRMATDDDACHMKKKFRDLVVQQMAQVGMTMAELSRVSGVSYDVINKLKRRPDSSTSAENAESLIRALNLDVADIVDHPEAGSGGDALVAVYDVAASAGHGSQVDAENVLCNMAFNQSFLQHMTSARADDLAIIRVKGHSMEPTLFDDDHVLVDRTKTNLSWDGMFVLRFDDVMHIKRIGRSAASGNVMVISDHPSYRDLDMPKIDLHVVGRVLWVGRKV